MSHIASRASRVYRGDAMRHISGWGQLDSASDSAYRFSGILPGEEIPQAVNIHNAISTYFPPSGKL